MDGKKIYYQQFKYISHCTYYWNIFSILETGKLIPGGLIKSYPPEASKIFAKILDDKMVNLSCISNDSVELVLSKKLFKRKFYFIFPFTYGDLNDVIYISPYLFNIIKKLNFNQKKFLEYVNKYIKNNYIKQILNDEVDELFNSKVIKNKKNLSLDELINFANNIDFILTIGFLANINLHKYLKYIKINKNMDINKREKLISYLDNNNIKHFLASYE